MIDLFNMWWEASLRNPLIAILPGILLFIVGKPLMLWYEHNRKKNRKKKEDDLYKKYLEWEKDMPQLVNKIFYKQTGRQMIGPLYSTVYVNKDGKEISFDKAHKIINESCIDST